MQQSLRFVSTGHGNGVNAAQVLLIMSPDTAPNRRMQAMAKKAGSYSDFSCGRGVRSLLLLSDGRIVGCSLTPDTMLRRLNNHFTAEKETSI